MDNLSILIKALLSPDSVKNIKTEIANLQKLFDNSPLKVKINIDNDQFKTFSNNISKISASIQQNINNVGLDKFQKRWHGVAGEALKATQEIRESVNAAGQLVKVIDYLDTETGDVARTTKIVTDNYKKLREEAQKALSQQEKIEQDRYIRSQMTAIKNIELRNKEERSAMLALDKIEQERYIKSQTAAIKNIESRNKAEQTAMSELEKIEQERYVRSQMAAIKNIELRNKAEKQSIEEQKRLQTDLQLFKQKMLGGNGIKGELDVFSSKNKGRYDTSILSNIRQEVEKLNVSTPDLKNKIKSLGIQFSNLKIQASQSGNVMTRAFENMFKFLRFYLLGGTFVKFVNSIKNGINTIVELDSAIVDLKKVSDELGKTVGIKEFISDMNELAISVGHSTKAAIESVTEFKKLGYSLQESSEMAKAALTYSNVADIGIKDATQSIISTLKGFQMEASQTTDLIDKINEVGNNFSITSGSIGEALQRSSSALFEANNSLDESIGLIVAANASVQDASKVGNSLKTVALRIRGISDESDEAIPKLDGLIKRITGVDIMKDENTFKSTYQIMVEIGNEWDKLTDTDRATLLEAMFGKHQANVGASLLNNIKDGVDAVTVSMNSFGSSAKEQAAYMDSIQAKSTTFKETMTKIWINTIDSETVKTIVDFGTAILKVVEKIGLLPVALATTTAALFLFSKGFQTFAVTLAPMVLQRLGLIVAAENGVAIAANGAAISVKLLSGAFAVLAPLIIVGSIYALVKVIDKLHVSMKELAQSVEESFNETQKNIDQLKSWQKEYEGLASKTELTREEKLKLINIERELKTRFGETAEQIDLQNGSLSDNIELMGELMEEEAKRFKLLNAQAYNKSKDLLNNPYTLVIGTGSSAIGYEFKSIQDAIKQAEKALRDAVGKSTIVFEERKKVLEDLYSKYDSAINIVSKYEGYENILNKTLDDTNSELDKQKQNIQAMQNEYIKYSNSINTLSAILNDLEKDGILSEESLNKISDSYQKLIPYLSDRAELQKKINELIDEERSKSGVEYFQKLTSILQDLYKIQSELNSKEGLSADSIERIISNYPEFIHLLENREELERAISGAITDQEKSQREAYNAMLANSETFFNESIKGNETLWNQIKLAYQTDYNNFHNVADLKLKVDNELRKILGEEWSKFYSSQEEALRASIEKLMRIHQATGQGDINYIRSLMDQYEIITGINREISSTGIDLKKVNLKDVKLDKSKDKDKSPYKPTIDAYRQINIEIERQNALLTKNNELQSVVSEKEKVKLLNDRISLIQTQIHNQEKLNDLQKKELDNLRSQLKAKGFKFDGYKVTNINHLKDFSDDSAKSVESLLGRFDELYAKAIPSTSNEILSLQNEIVSLNNEIKKIGDESRKAFEEAKRAAEEYANELKSKAREIEDLIYQAIQDREVREQKLRDSRIAMEQEVFKVIDDKYNRLEQNDKERLERVKENYLKEYELAKESLQRQKDLLRKELDEQRNLRDREKAEESIQSKQARLAELRRDNSGFYAGEIAQLEKEIADDKEDLYWKDVEAQVNAKIEAIDEEERLLDEKKAADEKRYEEELQRIVGHYEDLRQEDRKYAESVVNLREASFQQILDFLTKHSEEYNNATKLQKEQMIEEWKQIYDAARGIEQTYWDEVSEIMQGGQDKIIGFLTSNLDQYRQAGLLARNAFLESWGELYKFFEDGVTTGKITNADLSKLGLVGSFDTGGVIERDGIAAVHSKEMILNQRQIGNLFKVLQNPAAFRVPSINMPNVAGAGNVSIGDVHVHLNATISSDMDINKLNKKIGQGVRQEFADMIRRSGISRTVPRPIF